MNVIPKGRPNPLVDKLATVINTKKAIEKEYKDIVDQLKSVNRMAIAGNKSIVLFKNVERSSLDLDLLDEEERYVFERLKSKATVKTKSLSLNKVIPK